MELRRTWSYNGPGAAVGHEELRPSIRPSSQLAIGTLACSRCDAPVAIGDSVLTPADEVDCPYCSHRGTVREFLSLAPPTRPARVVVRVTGLNAIGA
ncbi:MAG TPA: hypothetical protein VMD48_02360 [Solirubrobacteraceae bacterium]|nr:hypothetical protein [Solirubrobacteraceae bacterium]